VLVAQVLVDAAEESRRTASIVVRMNEGAAMFARGDEELGRRVATFARSAARLDNSEDLRLRFANHEIRRLTQLFDGLERGSVEYEGEDRDWLLGLTEVAEASIDAISTASQRADRNYVDQDLWTSDLGLRYLHRQRLAIHRQVLVRRLFLLDEDPALDPDASQEMIRRLLEPHAKIGVTTRVLRSSNVDFIIRADLADFVLFDGKISYELEAAPSLGDVRPVIARSMLILDEARVLERRARFDSMWASAEEW
jgi:hypothetical protein